MLSVVVSTAAAPMHAKKRCRMPEDDDTSSSTLIDINLASEYAKSCTLGKLASSSSARDMFLHSKRQVNIRLSYLVVDAKSEYTKEEIMPDNVSGVIDKRITTLKAFGDAFSSAFKHELVVTKDTTIDNLKNVSKHLPIIEIKKENWKIRKGEEISFLLDGSTYGDKINELIDFTHVDTERWEDERVNALRLVAGNTIGVFYVRLGFTDVVYRPKNSRKFRNIVFRLEDTKVSFLGG
ncbi:hypothetical protein Pcinc_014764 [Petrolisthes cinctipes]|uniref:Uncharacterized protein n=1 Tax=Petrolisthes cinctipes TaxID=88211 RepID=A0AAE1FUB8_PETCI|nr:hypothetical protein Pcinc_014764 [Petrolisthes cinctipes]